MKIKYIFILIICLLNTQNLFAQYAKTMYNYSGSGNDMGVYFWYDMVITFSTPITGAYWMDVVPGVNNGIYSNNIKPDAISIIPYQMLIELL